MEEERKELITRILNSFNVGITDIQEKVGKTLTLYEIKPEIGVRISKIRNLKDEIAIGLEVPSVRIIAPMDNGKVGIEVPNKERKVVSIDDILNSWEYENMDMELPLAIGRTVTNDVFISDLADMPHLLVAGATGQGKSVGLNVMLMSLLRKKKPNELKLVLIDPKQVELSIYEKIEKQYLAHLEGHPSICTDYAEAQAALDAVVRLMESRYTMLKNAQARNIQDYNRVTNEKLPYYVVVIDEYGDLIMQSRGREMETAICRIAQKARAVGIHMIISTQRPAATIVTGNIKANFPTRIAFRTTTGTDSRVVIDQTGAEKLTGKGDMLFFKGAEVTRVQCAYVSTEEVNALCEGIQSESHNGHTFLPSAPPVQSPLWSPVEREHILLTLPEFRECKKGMDDFLWMFADKKQIIWATDTHDKPKLTELQISGYMKMGIISSPYRSNIGYSPAMACDILINDKEKLRDIYIWTDVDPMWLTPVSDYLKSHR